jgi:N-acetylneuraminic acid mutarotase
MRDKKVIRGILLFIIGLICQTCADEDLSTRSYPSVDTELVTDISADGATLNAKIISTGDAGISDHGFVYSNAPNPTLENSDRISLGNVDKTTRFSALANRNLVKDQKYYVRAYALAKETNFVVYGTQVEFTSMGGVAPVLKDFFGKDGVIGDTIIMIATGISDVKEKNQVYFGGVRATVAKVSTDSLWCIVADYTPKGENTVTLRVGQLQVNAESKFVLNEMRFTSVSPESISFGDTVTIVGMNFPKLRNLISATLLGKDAIVASVSSSVVKITFVDDVSIAESVVTLKAGVQTISSANSIKLLAPLINTVTPLKGTKDTEITISGKYFSPSKANTKVEINAKTLTITELTNTSIKAKVPSGITPGMSPLSVTISGQAVVATPQFEIIKPHITSINPLNGTWGSTLTVLGENFGPGIADNIVRFGTLQAQIVSAAPTEIKVQVPQNLLVKESAISVQAISTDNLKASYASPFTLDAPSITTFTPDKGKSNSIVTIQGQNFNPVAANHTVMFGDKQAQVISATPGTLVVKLPTSLVDSDVNIQVSVAGQTGTSAQLFHLESPWKKVTAYPGNGRTTASAFAAGSYGYVTLGNAPLNDKSCWRYDPSADAWLKVKSFSFVGFGSASGYLNTIAFSIDGLGYVGLGLVGGSPVSAISKYSPADDAWTASAPLGDTYAAGLESAVAYAINGKGYVTSGRNAQNKPDAGMKEFNPLTNSWQSKANFPGPARTEATGFTIGDKAFLTTGYGYTSSTYYNDLWAFNTLTNTWSQQTSLPGSSRMAACAFAIDGFGYLVGGSKSDLFLKDVWKFDPSTNSWTKLDDFPGAPRSDAVAFVVGNKAYFGIGYNATGQLDDFWEFDPSKL